MRNYSINGLEIRVGDGDVTAVRYYVSRVNGRGWRWDAYLGDLGGTCAGYSLTFAPTRDAAVMSVAEHYAARLGLEARS